MSVLELAERESKWTVDGMSRVGDATYMFVTFRLTNSKVGHSKQLVSYHNLGNFGC